jgi:O-antigen ligase
MLFLRSENPTSLPAFFCGLAILMFSALSLVLPSGYSYGSALLLLGSLSLILKRIRVPLYKNDWILISVLLMYFFFHVFSNILFSLPLRSYDGLLRFLLVIPVYLLLITHPPRPIYFWLGLMIGTLGAGIFAIFQKYFDVINWERSSGYMNAIQFGDISLLMASLLICGVVWAKYAVKNTYLAVIFFCASLFGYIASFLSLSRGGWLAIPIVLYVVYKILKSQTKKIFLVTAFFGSFLMIFTFMVLPESNLIKQRLIQTQLEISDFFEGGLSNEATSLNTRMQMWKNGLIAFKERPIAGWGDITAIKNHFPSQWEMLNSVGDFNHMHSEYIDALAKHGVMGIIVLMALLLVPLKYFLTLVTRTYDQDSVAFAAAGVVLIVCVMVFGLTQTFLAHISGVTIFSFYLVIITAYCRNFELSKTIS